MKIERIDPEGLFKLDAFTQIVTAEGAARTAYIAGQGAFDADLAFLIASVGLSLPRPST